MKRFTDAVRGVVATGGKTLGRSFDHAAGQGPVQMISAWIRSQRLVLGQQQVDGKSNEITAIPKLLELLELQGAVVTLDAMGRMSARHCPADRVSGSGLRLGARRPSGDAA